MTFHDAAFVLSDEDGDRYQLDLFDERVKTEDRWTTFAPDPEDRSILYVICWSPRGERTRIISARFADASEKRFYEENHKAEI